MSKNGKILKKGNRQSVVDKPHNPSVNNDSLSNNFVIMIYDRNYFDKMVSSKKRNVGMVTNERKGKDHRHKQGKDRKKSREKRQPKLR